ncbi:Cytosolic carboxypeptidase 6 [Plecturocebus cupreus]
MGFDLNRHWLDPSPWAHPTLHGVKQLIIQMYNDPTESCSVVQAGVQWLSRLTAPSTSRVQAILIQPPE